VSSTDRDLLDKIADRSALIGVVGLGDVGLPLGARFVVPGVADKPNVGERYRA
jgi:hypothetical protein